MTTTTSSASTAIAVAEPVFTGPEQLALAGFLAGYTGLTREAYALDLRQYASWCQLCRRRHKWHYADLAIMPTRPVKPLVGAAGVAERSA
jgi:hypothetical protein